MDLKKKKKQLFKLSNKQKKKKKNQLKKTRYLNRHLAKKINGWQIIPWKYAQHLMSLGNCTLKQQWALNTYYFLAKIQKNWQHKMLIRTQNLTEGWWEYKIAQSLWQLLTSSTYHYHTIQQSCFLVFVPLSKYKHAHTRS